MNHDITANGNVSPDIVRQQEGWLRELVRRLVNASEVEDVVQDTWVAALQTPVYLNGSLRGWLRTVATRMAMRTHRANSRRTRREQAAARAREVQPIQPEVLGTDVLERVTAAVDGLSAPYRETIRMRYFAGMSAREIAARTETPVATVRIRLQRGVQRLRDDLSRRCGPNWRPALALFALPSRETLAVHTARHAPWLGLPSIAAACVLIFLGMALSNAPRQAATELTAAVGVTTHEPVAAANPSPGTARLVRDSLPVRRHIPPTRRVTGRVLDPAGQPIGHAQIWFRRQLGSAAERRDSRIEKSELQRVGNADLRGRFNIDCPFGVGSLEARGLSVRGASSVSAGPRRIDDLGRLVSLCLWPIVDETETVRGARIVASHAVPMRGSVVDAQGNGLRDVRVVAHCTQLPSFPEILDHHLFVAPVDSAVTDESGRFVLPSFPADCPAQMIFSKPGYRQICLAPDPSVQRLRIPLTRAHARDPMHIAGRVFDLRGRVLCAATVGIARTRTQTGSDGQYRLDLAAVDLDAILYAGKKGYQTAVERDIGARLLRHRGGTMFVDLTLGPRSRSISGILTDGRGISLPGHLVFLADPFYLGGGSITAESLAAGQLENEFGASGIANTDGEFKIDGLAERVYGIRVYDKDTANATDAGSFAAGSHDIAVEIHERRFVTMTGQLRDDDGVAVVGARVYFGSAIRGRTNEVARLRAPVQTDANGGFVLKRLPRAGGTVYVVGGSNGTEIDAGIVPTYVKLDPSSLRQPELDLVVARLCHFRVTAPDAPRGSTIHFLDDYGEKLEILVLDATGYRHHDSWTLEDDTTQILCTSQRAKTLVLEDPDGLEISRIRLHLSPDFITEISL